MKIKITAGGIFGAITDENPTGELPVGTTLTVKEEPVGWAGRYVVLDGSEAKEKGGKTLVVNPADAKAPFEAKDKGGGWWAIYDADGKEVKSLRKDDAEIFNALSDEDKAKHVAGLKAE